MANSGKKKIRKVKGAGTVYYDNRLFQWVGQIESGKYSNGRTKYTRFYADGQNTVIDKMRDYISSHPAVAVLSGNGVESEMTFESYLSAFLATVKKARLKPSSYTRCVQQFTKHIAPAIGCYKLSELTTGVIQTELINKLLDAGQSYSSIHKAYILVNESLQYAFRQGYISLNPCELVSEPSKNVAPRRKEIRFFSDEEIDKFKEAALSKRANGEMRYRNGLILVSIIYTGLRVGEMMALKWGDVDLENGVLRVHSNTVTAYENGVRKVIIQDSTKTRDHRSVYLTKTAADLFAEMNRSFEHRLDDYVYYSPTSRDVNNALGTYSWICKRAGIENHQGLHTLRHTFASLMIRKGVDIKIVSEMLGHSSVTFTYNTYVHLQEDDKADAIKRLAI